MAEVSISPLIIYISPPLDETNKIITSIPAFISFAIPIESYYPIFTITSSLSGEELHC